MFGLIWANKVTIGIKKKSLNQEQTHSSQFRPEKSAFVIAVTADGDYLGEMNSSGQINCDKILIPWSGNRVFAFS